MANKASEGALPPRSAAASGRLVLPAQARRVSLLGCLGWAGAAPKHHAASSDADTAIELLSKVVTWPVLVWFGRQRGMKNWVCDGLYLFLGALGGLLCARGRRASGCGRSGGPTSRDCRISPLKQSTSRDMFAWFASVSWDTPRRVEQTPKIERRNRMKKSKKTSCQI